MSLPQRLFQKDSWGSVEFRWRVCAPVTSDAAKADSFAKSGEIHENKTKGKPANREIGVPRNGKFNGVEAKPTDQSESEAEAPG